MKRRAFTHLGLASLFSASVSAGAAEQADIANISSTQTPPGSSGKPFDIGMLIYPNMSTLDLVGPQTVLFLLPNARIHLVWKELAAVPGDIGFSVMPTHTFDTCPQDLDILFVPGGLRGTTQTLSDEATIAFLADRGRRARYVTSVCTGSLLLGAAGLLKGYRATSHWYVRDLLPQFGAQRSDERVVLDRNRMTSAGVTSGLDFGLTLMALVAGDNHAKQIQLLLEYDPKPPFNTGSPQAAGPAFTNAVLAARGPFLDPARKAVQLAATRMTSQA